MLYYETNSMDATYNFAVEFFLLTRCNLEDDVLLLWNTHPTLMLGKYQDILKEINWEEARTDQVDIVRRFSGGGTIYTDPGTIQFSVITQKIDEDESLDFSTYGQMMVDSLRKLGFDLEMSGRNDMHMKGKKVCGNAMYKRNKGYVHHGSLLFDVDSERMAKYLNPDPEKFKSKGISSVRERITNMLDYQDEFSLVEIKGRLIKDICHGELSLDEAALEEIEAIQNKELRNKDYIYGKSPKASASRKVKCLGGNMTFNFEIDDLKIKSMNIFGDFFGELDGIESFLEGTVFRRDEIESKLKDFGWEKKVKDFPLEQVLDQLF